MKFVKGISLFFIYPCIMLGLGIYAGIVLHNYFYPGAQARNMQNNALYGEEIQVEMLPVSLRDAEVLTADTEYVIEEYDTRRDTLVEGTYKVPQKYLGMDRDTFVTAMELYALSPPLAEQERGFVGLEVRSFSASRVIVRVNYVYVEPTKSFYLRVENNAIVVYCDDRQTVYMYTDISAELLPEYLLSEVITGMFVQDEAELYHFLETYSS